LLMTFRFISRFISILLIAQIISACSWFGDEPDEAFLPAPLTDIDEQFKVSPDWSAQVGDGVGKYLNKLAPAVYNDKIIVADSYGLVAAFDLNGKSLWKTEVGSELFGGVTAASGLVAVGSTDAEVIVLDAETGKEKWRNLVSSEVISAPAIGGGKVVAHSIDGKLFAMDATTGERVWLYDRNVPALTLRGTSAVTVVRGVVVTGFANGKVAVFILETGQVAWEKRVATPAGRSELDRIIDVDATPVVFGDTLYAVTYNGNIAAFAMRSGEVLWQRELSSFQNISVDGQLIMVTDSNSHVKALDRLTGATLWTQSDLKRRSLTAPVAFGNYVVAGDYDGYVHWLDRNSGRIVARNHVGGDGIIADPVVANDKLYIYTRDGSLYAFSKP
jgi:outer membrane protein assembly factor BamB